MTAKEKQIQFITTYLKPTLKTIGYRTSGQTWWKDKGDFFTLFNLQNFSWNSEDSVDFCFNIGIALKASLKGTHKKKPTVNDLTVYLRESAFLPDNRQECNFRNKTGYILTKHTDLNDFMTAFKSDFENHILPTLESLISIQDCLDKFGDIEFSGDNLKRAIAENKPLV
jgi:hypothetical protein